MVAVREWHGSGVVGVPVRVHDRHGDDLGVAHVPPPVELGDLLELGRGPILLFRVVDLVDTGPHSPRRAREGVTRGDARPSGSCLRIETREHEAGGLKASRAGSRGDGTR